MLSVKDINNKRFEQARPGYKTEEVDDFLREVARDIERYQRDKEETDKKMAVLVESIREYKKDEEALKDALVGAQKQGRAVIAEAQAQADKIISDARAKANEIIGSTKVQLEKEKRCLVKMQQEVSDFKAELLNMYKQHLELITAIPEYDDDTPEQPAPAPQPVRQQEPQPQPVQQSAQYVPPQHAAVPASQTQQVSQTSQQDFEATRVMDNPYRQEKAASGYPFDDPLAGKQESAESKFGDLKFGGHNN